MNAITIAAPVVSSDVTSPESILARRAKQVEEQIHANTAYDDKTLLTEGFEVQTLAHRSRNLLYGAIASAAFLTVFVAIFRK